MACTPESSGSVAALGREMVRPALAREPGAELVGRPSVVCCANACGFRAQVGRDPNGRPYQLCCSSCMPNEGSHANDCARIPVGTEGDELYNQNVALHMQLEELRSSTQGRQLQLVYSAGQRQEFVEGDLDGALARDIHFSEVEDARRRREQMQVEAVIRYSVQEAEYEQVWQRGWRGFCCGRPLRGNEDPYLETDQIWGDFPRKEGVDPTWFDKVVWNTCPCFVVGCGRTGRRLWKRYFLTFSVLFGAAQVVMFISVTIVSGGMVPLTNNPMIGPGASMWNDMGAKNAAKILYDYEWWRLFTPVLLHVGVIHLCTNLLMQLRYSVDLELIWGPSIWLCIYIGSGIFASLASCINSPNTLSVGSSGALCGLIGAWLVFLLITWNQTLPGHAATRNTELCSILFCILLMFASSLMPLMDFAAHIGGLLMGAALGLSVFARMLQDKVWRYASQIAGILLLASIWIPAIWWFTVKTKPSAPWL